MKITRSKTFKAIATLGLKRGYTEEVISINDFKEKLAIAQQRVHEQFNIQLSTKVSPCSIVFLGQNEPSVDLSFIQYPKFPNEESQLKEGILLLVEILMISLDQNRVVIVFEDEIYMLEEDGDLIDPGIRYKNSK